MRAAETSWKNIRHNLTPLPTGQVSPATEEKEDTEDNKEKKESPPTPERTPGTKIKLDPCVKALTFTNVE